MIIISAMESKRERLSSSQGNDPFLFTFPDNEHSANENRFINIGLSANSRILVLPHTERKDKIRIISCRKATVQERRFYEKGSY